MALLSLGRKAENAHLSDGNAHPEQLLPYSTQIWSIKLVSNELF
jgi:hypothetical protein